MKKLLNHPVSLICFLALIPLSPLNAQYWGNEGLEMISHSMVSGGMTQGPFTDAFIIDDLMYYSDLYGFNIYDISDAANPQQIGNTPVPGLATDFSISGDYAYVCSSFGFLVIDISVPANPIVKEHILVSSIPFQIIAEDGYAFVATPFKLISYSLADPENPVLLDELSIPPSNLEIAGLAKSGTIIYYANQRNLYVIDSGDPSNLQLHGSAQEFNPTSPNGTCWGSLTVHNGYLYVVVTTALHIYNLSDPLYPSLVYETVPGNSSIYDIVVEDNTLVVNHWSSGPWQICDISDPGSPVLMYESDYDPFFNTYSLGTLKNNLLVVLDGGQQGYLGYTVHLLDITGMTSPQEISTFQSLPGITKSVALMDIEGQMYALVAQDNRAETEVFSGFLRIVDMSDPSSPQLVSSLEFPTSCITVAPGDDDYVFIRGYNYNWPIYAHYLYLVSIADINNPQILQEVEIGSAYSYEQFSSLFFQDKYLYVASATHLKIFEVVSNALSLTGQVSIYGQNGYSVFLNGSDFAYVAGGQNGLQIYNVSDPSTPLMQTWGDTPGTCMDAFIYNGIAYCADFEYGLRIFDVSQNTVVPIGNYITLSEAMSVSYNQGIVYLGMLDGRIEMIDVSVPSAPVSLGWYLTPGMVNDMMFDPENNYMYVADEYDLSVLRPEITIGLNERQLNLPEPYFYPNPCSGQLTFDFSLAFAESVQVILYNCQGMKVSTLLDHCCTPGTHRFVLNVNDLSSGVYFIELRTGHESRTQKIVIRN